MCNLHSCYIIHLEVNLREVLGVRDVRGLLGYPSSLKTRVPPDMTTSLCTADVNVRLHLQSTFVCPQRPIINGRRDRWQWPTILRETLNEWPSIPWFAKPKGSLASWVAERCNCTALCNKIQRVDWACFEDDLIVVEGDMWWIVLGWSCSLGLAVRLVSRPIRVRVIGPSALGLDIVAENLREPQI
jgi:hypothetical protein